MRGGETARDGPGADDERGGEAAVRAEQPDAEAAGLLLC
jgi:hypothetical protein